MKTLFTSLIIFVFLISGVIAGTGLLFAEKGEYRGFWVDGFNPGFKTPVEITQLVKDLRETNCNVIFVEVRKYADAYYNSSLEPKATDIAPDFDPLAELIKQCHDTSGGKQYIEVHPWLVTYRCNIEGMKIPETEPKHILFTHPEWVGEDYNGNKFYEKRQYLDQGVPGVIDHTVNVIMDIVNHYDVDGIHYDYVRYAELSDTAGKNLWGYNPITVARFNKLYKKTGKPEPGDPQWTSFRHRQIFDLLRKVYADVKAIKPLVKVSASTTNWGSLKEGFEKSAPYLRTLQNWPSWMAKGVLDINCIMNYKRYYEESQKKDFDDWSRLTIDSKNNRFAIIGLGAYMNSIDDTLKQIESVRAMKDSDGIIFFSYAETNKDKKDRKEFLDALKSGPFKKSAKIPSAKWVENPDTGIIMGTIKSGSTPVDGAGVVTDKGEEIRTDGTGFYAFLNMKPGTYYLTAVFNDAKFEIGAVELKKGQVLQRDLDISKGK